LSLLRRVGAPPDATLLALNADEAPLAKSFLPPGPVYASSQIADGLPPPMLRDLEGVRYVEIPWLADPAGAIFARLPHTSLGDPVLDRLYALGLDAFAIAELLANPIPRIASSSRARPGISRSRPRHLCPRRPDHGDTGRSANAIRTDAMNRGAAAEALAASYLAARGLTIVQRNCRCRGGESISSPARAKSLVFVEVRLRR
jgi:hypothetical protein